ncbi:hypothetical protein CEXT_175171 [Caerostris extrusa]|uniref:Uncharacterized protein n=1 Tax=Caerostris extrusa TaxID=172846 RepID=A0AAV4XL06_CAEEX|nr:hypothetical protein CEXT_175171 [Caerostris extrusa]
MSPFFQVARGLSTGGYINKYRCIDFLYRMGFRFDPPLRIATDHGTQFEALTKFLVKYSEGLTPLKGFPATLRRTIPSRSEQVFKLLIHGRQSIVNTDRLKPAYISKEEEKHAFQSRASA